MVRCKYTRLMWELLISLKSPSRLCSFIRLIICQCRKKAQSETMMGQLSSQLARRRRKWLSVSGNNRKSLQLQLWSFRALLSPKLLFNQKSPALLVLGTSLPGSVRFPWPFVLCVSTTALKSLGRLFELSRYHWSSGRSCCGHYSL